MNGYCKGYENCLSDMNEAMETILKEDIDYDVSIPGLRDGITQIVSHYFDELKSSMKAYKEYEEDIN